MKKLLPVTIYADTTGQFTDEECDRDNTVEILVPRDLLYQWFVETCQNDGPFFEEFTGTDPIPVTERGFLKWVYAESTADDTVELYHWLNVHGFTWTRSRIN